MSIVKRIKAKPEEYNDKISGMLRYQQAERWIARTRDELGIECNGWDQIKFDDPQISLEWKICDLANIVMIQSDKMRPKFEATLTPEELEYFHSDEEALTEFINTPFIKQLIKGRKNRK